MNYTQKMLNDAHKHSSHNEDEIADTNSYLCACFHCCTLFPVEKITEWAEQGSAKGATALCPVCGIDSVLVNRCGFPIHEGAFIVAMRNRWFVPKNKKKK